MEVPNADIRPPDFHEGQLAVMKCTQQRRIVIGANSWGHTTAGILDVLWCARGKHPFRVVESSPSQFWVCAHSYGVLQRVHWPAFDSFCPPSWINLRRQREHYVDIKRNGGGTCRIWFRSTDPKSWRALKTRREVNGVWIDGPPREDHFNRAMEQLETCGGWIMLTFTPTSAKHRWWWHERIWDPAKTHHDACKQKGMDLEPEDWWTYLARLATRDPGNQLEHEVGRVLVPHFRRAFDRKKRVYAANHACECEERGTCKACRERTVAFAGSLSDPQERGIRIFGEIPSQQESLRGTHGHWRR